MSNEHRSSQDEDMKVAREVVVGFLGSVQTPDDVELVEAIARALASQREETLTEVASRVSERDYDAWKIVGEIAAAIRAGKKG